MATAGGSPSSPTLTAVQVALRVRPPPSSLTGRGARPVLSVVSTTDDTIPPTSVFVDGRKSFSFDRVYAPTDSTETLYNGSVRPLVSRFTEGYNTTILAYGQTGSGKTHTMLDTDGVVHRVARDVFGHFDQARDDKAVLERDITVSFIEIYNEDVLDLLVIPPSKGVVVREDPVKGIVWQGAREVVVEHPDDIIRNLESGLEFRQTVSTILNQTSSRSHAIFSINLRQRQWIPPTSEDDPADTGDWQIIHSKFHFVDLAGSERLKRTNAVGERQREGIHINSGLLALGNVINALGGGGPADHASHVPYRDSKLTRLLQDGLGGNSETLMIACASPCEADLGETLNTLKWANRGRNIHNSAVVNHEYQSEMRALKEQVAQLRDQVVSQVHPPSDDDVARLRQENEQLRKKLDVIADQQQSLKQRNEVLTNELGIMQAEPVMSRLFAPSPTPSLAGSETDSESRHSGIPVPKTRSRIRPRSASAADIYRDVFPSAPSSVSNDSTLFDSPYLSTNPSPAESVVPPSSAFRKLRNELRETTMAARQYLSQLDELRAQNREKDEEIGELKALNAGAEDYIAGLEQQLSKHQDLADQVERLEEELEKEREARDELTNASEDAQSFSTQLEEWKKRAAAAEEDAQTAWAKVAKLENDVFVSRSVCDETDNQSDVVVIPPVGTSTPATDIEKEDMSGVRTAISDLWNQLLREETRTAELKSRPADKTDQPATTATTTREQIEGKLKGLQSYIGDLLLPGSGATTMTPGSAASSRAASPDNDDDAPPLELVEPEIIDIDAPTSAGPSPRKVLRIVPHAPDTDSITGPPDDQLEPTETELDTLQTRCRTLESELDQLRRVQSFTQQDLDLAADNLKLQHEVDNAAAAFTVLEGLRSALEKEVKDLKANLADLTETLAGKEAEVATAQAEIERLKKLLEDSDRELAVCTRPHLDDNDGSGSALVCTRPHLDAGATTVSEGEVSDLLRENTKLKNELGGATKAFKILLTIRGEHEAQIRALHQKESALESSVQALNTQVLDKDSEVESARQELERLQALMAETDHDIDLAEDKKSKGADKKLAKLRKGRKKLKEQVLGAEHVVEGLEGEKADLQRELDDLKREQTEMKDEVDTLKAKLDDVTSAVDPPVSVPVVTGDDTVRALPVESPSVSTEEFAVFQASEQKLRNELSAATQAFISLELLKSRHENQLSAAQTRQQDLIQQLADVTTQLDQLRSKMEAKEGELADARNKLLGSPAEEEREWLTALVEKLETDVKDMRAAYTELEALKQSHEQALAEPRTQISDLQKQGVDYLAQYTAAQAELSTMQRSASEDASERADLVGQIASLTAALADLKTGRDAQEVRLADLVRERDGLVANSSNRDIEPSHHASTIIELQTRIETLTHELDTATIMVAEYEKVKPEHERLLSEAVATREGLEREIEELKSGLTDRDVPDAHSAELEVLKGQLADMQVAREAADAEVLKHGERVKELEAEIESVNAKLVEVELVTAESVAHGGRVKELETLVEELKDDHTTRELPDVAEPDTESHGAQIELLESKLAEAESGRETAVAESVKLQEEIERLKNDLGQPEQVSTERITEMELLQSKLAEAEASREAVDAKLAKHATQVTNLEAQIIQLKSDLAAAEESKREAEIALEEASHAHKQVEELTIQLEQKTSEHTGALAELETLKAEVDAAREKAVAADAEHTRSLQTGHDEKLNEVNLSLESARAQISDLEKELEDVRSQHTTAQSKLSSIEEIQTTLSSKEQELDGLKTQLATLIESETHLKSETHSHLTTITDLNQRIVEHDASSQQLQARVEELEKEIEVKNLAVKEFEGQLEIKNLAVKEFEEQLAAVSGVEARIPELEAEIEQVKKEFADAVDTRAAIETRVSDVTNQHETLTARLAEVEAELEAEKASRLNDQNEHAERTRGSEDHALGVKDLSAQLEIAQQELLESNNLRNEKAAEAIALAFELDSLRYKLDNLSDASLIKEGDRYIGATHATQVDHLKEQIVLVVKELDEYLLRYTEIVGERNDVLTLNLDLANAREMIEILETEKEILRARLAELQDSHDTHRRSIADLEPKLGGLETERQALLDEKNALTAQVESHKTEIEALKETASTSTVECQKHTQRLTELEKELVVLTESEEALKSQLAGREDEIAKLLESASAATADYELHSTRLKELEEELARVVKEKEEHATDRDLLRESDSTKASELAEASARVDVLESERAELQEELKDAQRMETDLLDRCAVLTQKLEDLSAAGTHRDSLLNELEMLNQDMHDRDTECAELSVELSRLNTERVESADRLRRADHMLQDAERLYIELVELWVMSQQLRAMSEMEKSAIREDLTLAMADRDGLRGEVARLKSEMEERSRDDVLPSDSFTTAPFDTPVERRLDDIPPPTSEANQRSEELERDLKALPVSIPADAPTMQPAAVAALQAERDALIWERNTLVTQRDALLARLGVEVTHTETRIENTIVKTETTHTVERQVIMVLPDSNEVVPAIEFNLLRRERDMLLGERNHLLTAVKDVNPEFSLPPQITEPADGHLLTISPIVQIMNMQPQLDLVRLERDNLAAELATYKNASKTIEAPPTRLALPAPDAPPGVDQSNLSPSEIALQLERDALIQELKVLKSAAPISAELVTLQSEKDALIEKIKVLEATEPMSSELRALRLERDALIEKIKVLEAKAPISVVDKDIPAFDPSPELKAAWAERDALIQQLVILKSGNPTSMVGVEEESRAIVPTIDYEAQLAALRTERDALLQEIEELRARFSVNSGELVVSRPSSELELSRNLRVSPSDDTFQSRRGRLSIGFSPETDWEAEIQWRDAEIARLRAELDVLRGSSSTSEVTHFVRSPQLLRALQERDRLRSVIAFSQMRLQDRQNERLRLPEGADPQLYQSLLDEIAALESEVERLRFELETANERVTVEEKTVEETKYVPVDGDDAEELRYKLAEATHERDRVAAELAELFLSTNNQKGMEDIQRLDHDEEKKKLRALCDANEFKLLSVQKELEDLRSAHEPLTRELPAMKESHAGVMNERDTLAQELLALKNEKDGLAREVEELKSAQEPIKSELTRSVETHTLLKDEHEKLSRELADLKTTHDRLTVELSQIKENINVIQKEREEVANELRDLKAAHEPLTTELARTTESHTTVQNERDGLLRELQDLKAAHDSTRTELHGTNEAHTILEKERDALVQELQKLKTTHTENFRSVAVSPVVADIAETEALRKERDQLASELSQLRDDLPRSGDVSEEFYSVINAPSQDLQREVDLRDQEIDRLKIELANARQAATTEKTVMSNTRDLPTTVTETVVEETRHLSSPQTSGSHPRLLKALQERDRYRAELDVARTRLEYRQRELRRLQSESLIIENDPKVLHLQNEVAALKEEVNRLRAELKAANEAVTVQETTVEETRYVPVEGEEAETHTRLMALSAERDRLAAELDNLRLSSSGNQDHVSHRSAQSFRTLDHGDEAAKLRALLESKDIELRSVQKELDVMRSSIRPLKEELAESKDTYMALQKERYALARNLDALKSSTALSTDLSREVVAPGSVQEMDALRQERDLLASELNHLRSTLPESREVTREHHTVTSAPSLDLQDKLDRRDAEIARLRAKLDSMGNGTSTFRHTIVDRTGQDAAAQEAIEAKAQLVGARHERDGISFDLADAENRLKDRQDELYRARSSSKKHRTNFIPDLLREINELEAEVDRLRVELDTANEAVTIQETIVEETRYVPLDDEVTELYLKLAEVIQERNILTTELAGLRLSSPTSNQSHNVYTHRAIRGLQSEDSLDEMERLRSRCAAVERKWLVARKELEEWQSEYNPLRRELAQAKDSYVALQRERDALNAEKEFTEAEFSRFKAAHERSRKSQKERESDALVDIYRTQIAEVVAERNGLHSVNQDLEQRMTEREDALKHLQELREERNGLKKTVDEMNDMVADLRRQLKERDDQMAASLATHNMRSLPSPPAVTVQRDLDVEEDIDQDTRSSTLGSRHQNRALPASPMSATSLMDSLRGMAHLANGPAANENGTGLAERERQELLRMIEILSLHISRADQQLAQDADTVARLEAELEDVRSSNASSLEHAHGNQLHHLMPASREAQANFIVRMRMLEERVNRQLDEIANMEYEMVRARSLANTAQQRVKELEAELDQAAQREQELRKELQKYQKQQKQSRTMSNQVSSSTAVRAAGPQRQDTFRLTPLELKEFMPTLLFDEFMKRDEVVSSPTTNGSAVTSTTLAGGPRSRGGSSGSYAVGGERGSSASLTAPRGRTRHSTRTREMATSPIRSFARESRTTAASSTLRVEPTPPVSPLPPTSLTPGVRNTPSMVSDDATNSQVVRQQEIIGDLGHQLSASKRFNEELQDHIRHLEQEKDRSTRDTEALAERVRKLEAMGMPASPPPAPQAYGTVPTSYYTRYGTAQHYQHGHPKTPPPPMDMITHDGTHMQSIRTTEDDRRSGKSRSRSRSKGRSILSRSLPRSLTGGRQQETGYEYNDEDDDDVPLGRVEKVVHTPVPGYFDHRGNMVPPPPQVPVSVSSQHHHHHYEQPYPPTPRRLSRPGHDDPHIPLPPPAGDMDYDELYEEEMLDEIDDRGRSWRDSSRGRHRSQTHSVLSGSRGGPSERGTSIFSSLTGRSRSRGRRTSDTPSSNGYNPHHHSNESAPVKKKKSKFFWSSAS